MASVKPPKPEVMSMSDASFHIESQLRAHGIQLSGYDLLSDVTRSDPTKRRGYPQIEVAKKDSKRYFRTSDIEWLITLALCSTKPTSRPPAIEKLIFRKHETAAERERHFTELV
ncbi:hypothetical protein NT239_15490 [Chitinibacter sp. SCUT-21]|uniref:hypothetical protein n=1 Tax=Chitinibacter sp. SCUT-21 TaxID=2970891 RepID=UPI0035A70137